MHHTPIACPKLWGRNRYLLYLEPLGSNHTCNEIQYDCTYIGREVVRHVAWCVSMPVTFEALEEEVQAKCNQNLQVDVSSSLLKHQNTSELLLLLRYFIHMYFCGFAMTEEYILVCCLYDLPFT